MLLKMTEEPDDYEGKWPRRDAMTTDEAREFFKFLHGEVPWNGTWFGEYAPGQRGAYWWRKHLKAALESLIAAPAAPVQQAEPVGYFQRDCDYFEQVEDVYQWDADVIPLYLHPPPAEVQRLREAAYNAIEAFDQGAHGADEIDALRRALEGGE